MSGLRQAVVRQLRPTPPSDQGDQQPLDIRRGDGKGHRMQGTSRRGRPLLLRAVRYMHLHPVHVQRTPRSRDHSVLRRRREIQGEHTTAVGRLQREDFQVRFADRFVERMRGDDPDVGAEHPRHGHRIHPGHPEQGATTDRRTAQCLRHRMSGLCRKQEGSQRAGFYINNI